MVYEGGEGKGRWFIGEGRVRIVYFMFTKQLFISKMLKCYKSSVYCRFKFLLPGHSEHFVPDHCFLKNAFFGLIRDVF